LKERYGKVDLRIMQASGGSMTTDDARGRAVNIVNSGPAGGALAAAYVGTLTGDQQIIGVDMGGTSFDIGLIDQGEPRVAPESQFEGFPVKMPILDVHAIGAGGGSLAWVDQGGALNVGPESAGSEPGPACYGLGGERPTVTDANLVLGRLNADYFLGGEMKLYPELAEKAIQEHVAKPLGISLEEAASGIIRVVNANMVRGISVSSTERGFDVREFALLPFGGAGPLHAMELAEDLGMSRVVIPMYPSTLSAVGLLVANTRHDYVTTMAKSQADLVPEEVLVTRKETLTQADIDEVIDRFHQLHYRIYAYGSAEEMVEFINLRVGAIGKVPPMSFLRRDKAGSDPSAASKGTRPVYYPAHGFIDTPVYERDLLQPGNVISGPCLVEEIASTSVITPEARGTVDEYGNIIVELGGGG